MRFVRALTDSFWLGLPVGGGLQLIWDIVQKLDKLVLVSRKVS